MADKVTQSNAPRQKTAPKPQTTRKTTASSRSAVWLPETLDIRPANLLRLQRAIGNRAVSNLLPAERPSVPVQALTPTIGTMLQRLLTTDKLYKKRKQAAIARVKSALEGDIEKCYIWAVSLSSFDAFTENDESFSIYQKAAGLKITSSEIEEAAGNDSSQFVSEANAIIESKNKGGSIDEPAKPKKESSQVPKEKDSGKVPKVLEFSSPSLVAAPSRPQAGNSVTVLNQISKMQWPSTYAETMYNISQNKASGLSLTVQSPQLLQYNQGTSQETVEVKIKLGQYSVVVHYHPRAEMPKGALSGESNIHIKGERAKKYKHENVTDEFIVRLGAPTLAEIKAQFVK